jgi:hypothetical protein
MYIDINSRKFNTGKFLIIYKKISFHSHSSSKFPYNKNIPNLMSSTEKDKDVTGIDVCNSYACVAGCMHNIVSVFCIIFVSISG